jgi:hypothetical protein
MRLPVIGVRREDAGDLSDAGSSVGCWGLGVRGDGIRRQAEAGVRRQVGIPGGMRASGGMGASRAGRVNSPPR